MRKMAQQRLDVVLATATRLTGPDVDDAPLRGALAAAGLRADTLAWDDPAVDWSATALCLLRSTWNYVHNLDAFLAWTERCAVATQLWNPPPIVRWNSHKSYLLDLQARGLPVVPTRLVRCGARLDVRETLGVWPAAVIKPAVGAGSFETIRISGDDLAASQAYADRLTGQGDVLAQPYIRSVADYGERALVWVDGELTHAVRKNARFAGDPLGITPVGIADDEAALALRVLAAIPGPLMYARVDLVRDEDGRPRLMELELIEPSLWFEHGPRALTRFVEGAARLARSPRVSRTA